MKATSKRTESKASGQTRVSGAKRRSPELKETLVVEKLGPIGKLEIQPRPLTILIGEQASGKSLVALLLYFFRGLETHLGRIYSPDLIQEKKWPQQAISEILDNLRGVPFNQFANGTASVRYKNDADEVDWTVRIHEKTRLPHIAKSLTEKMLQWHQTWWADPLALGKTRRIGQVFIPTERSMFTRLSRIAPSVLFDPRQPEPLRHFGELLVTARLLLSPDFLAGLREIAGKRSTVEKSDSTLNKAAIDYILACERRALGGREIFDEKQNRWLWTILRAQSSKILQVEGTASGQMEAWPFFVMARTLGVVLNRLDFYFEEPETHLHPQAQVEVMKVIAYMVNMGHKFVVTTHSPFIGYVVDNMIQRYISHKGKVPKDQIALNPDDVAAYRLRQRPEDPPEDIMDRKDTKLLKLDELEQVADELGKEFDELMDMAE